ncbi:DUF4232 domain-containing protein [Streptomyces sp. NPDC059398]|uniref:DUF4232 domain-containing protein n=1 Tax=Streptomyces sp. NPDC059398 TaxID=3346820 RepID=UPI0036BE1522
MKYTRITALAAVSLAATLSLTACDGDASSKDTSSKGSSSSASSSDSSSGASSSSDGGSKTEGGSGSGGAQDSGTKAGSGKVTETETTANGGSGSSGKVTFCKTANLAIDAKNASPTKTDGEIYVTMVNRGSTTCSATGYAGVDITDADHTSSPADRGHAVPRITTLKPGDTAIFNISYKIDPTGKSYTHPTNIQVTPPNETHTVNLKWPAGAGQVKDSYVGVEVYPTHNK